MGVLVEIGGIEFEASQQPNKFVSAFCYLTRRITTGQVPPSDGGLITKKLCPLDGKFRNFVQKISLFISSENRIYTFGNGHERLNIRI